MVVSEPVIVGAGEVSAIGFIESAEVGESHGFLDPGHGDAVGGTISVFGDNHIGFTGTIFGVVVFGPVQKYDDIGVLFDGSTFAQVAESWPFVFSVFDSAVELSECDDRDVEFFGECFESSRDERDLLFAGCSLVFGLDQLQVIDNDDGDPISSM